jgi:CHAT domain-containing protein
MENFHNNRSDFNTFKCFARPLYVYLFKPIQLKLNNNINHITISPSIHTGNVNFESLIEDTNATGFKQLNYLFKKYTFNYQVSLSLSDYLAKQQSNKNMALAFMPNYKNTTKNELPFLLKQADNLLNYNYKIYSGEQSSPTMFMLGSSNAKYIHVAGHSSLIRDDYGSKYSMLFNNKNKDLVKLSVSDIIKTKLNADLVVLALCETGAGDDLSGEANLNMAYYFTRAGAKSCVYGINKLEDKSAAFILDYFYYFLNQGLAKDDALYCAKLKYLEVERFDEEYSPIFWSSLAVQGNIKPIYFNARNKPNVYLLLLAESIFTGLVCLGLFGKKFTIK